MPKSRPQVIQEIEAALQSGVSDPIGLLEAAVYYLKEDEKRLRDTRPEINLQSLLGETG